MDNLTHSLVGALLGQAGLKKKTGLAMSALIIGANLPDVDAACFFWLEGAEHLGFRRGITHGPPAMVILPLILAGLLYGYDRWQAKRGKRPEGRLPVNFKWLFLLSFIGCLTHPALDWLNVYGIRLLEPFSSEWFYGDTLFIIDVWLWALMGMAVFWSLRREGRDDPKWRRPALAAIPLGLAYILVNSAISSWAVSAGTDRIALQFGTPEKVIASPTPFNPFKRELIWEKEEHVGFADFVVHTYRPVELREGVLKALPETPEYALDIGWSNDQFNAFQFWSRVPFYRYEEKGDLLHVVIGDARFTDPLAGDRFTVSVPIRSKYRDLSQLAERVPGLFAECEKSWDWQEDHLQKPGYDCVNETHQRIQALLPEFHRQNGGYFLSTDWAITLGEQTLAERDSAVAATLETGTEGTGFLEGFRKQSNTYCKVLDQLDSSRGLADCRIRMLDQALENQIELSKAARLFGLREGTDER